MPPATFTCTTDPLEARRWFAGLVRREPHALSVIASVTDGLVADPTRYANPRWWAGREGGEVVAAFMHTPPQLLHVGLATTDQARGLAAELAGRGGSLPGVGGRREPAEAFADEWCAVTGDTRRTTMKVGMFDLPARPRLPFAVSGSFRVAGLADLDLVQTWVDDFHEAVEHARTPAPSWRPHVEDGRVGLWEDDGEPVSMAYASTAHGGVTRISGVYTPPERRGHGYASAVVATLSNARMDLGQHCMLFTDLANPTSNAIYQALGYRRIGDSITIAFGH